jgi:LmbE family N-acetylglucosaminyl deacetylase
MNSILADIINNKKTCYFISPHLDDAAFSAGGLISYLIGKTEVVVITVFTEPGKSRHSLSALRYVNKCGYSIKKVENFFGDRRNEDRILFERIGAKVIHLGFLDALWRPDNNPNIFKRILGIFINDFRYIYPTHRLHISKGIIHENDKRNIEEVKGKIRREIEDKGGRFVVFSPLGTGKHVDHIVVRNVCRDTFSDVIFWEDSPYNLYHPNDEDFIRKNKLKEVKFGLNQQERKKMYPAYKTQFSKIFPNENDFKLKTEIYFIKGK